MLPETSITLKASPDRDSPMAPPDDQLGLVHLVPDIPRSPDGDDYVVSAIHSLASLPHPSLTKADSERYVGDDLVVLRLFAVCRRSEDDT